MLIPVAQVVDESSYITHARRFANSRAKCRNCVCEPQLTELVLKFLRCKFNNIREGVVRLLQAAEQFHRDRFSRLQHCYQQEAMNENAMEPGDILTPNQLAERLQVGVNWVYEKSRSRGGHSGKPLPVLHCGRYLRFYWPDVCAWMHGD